MSLDAPSSTSEAIDRAVHDLNNVCATLFGFATLAADDAEPGSALEGYLAEINKAAERANLVAQRLHQLSKDLRARDALDA
jgi:signal transduction histidine kinase